jgi:hypothetical protein
MKKSGYQWFTYTHKPLTTANREAIAAVQGRGLVINLSADSPAQADELYEVGVAPVTTVLPEGVDGKVYQTPKGRRIVVCPAHYRDAVTCATCGTGRPLCARLDRDYVIGFPAHGSGKRKASEVAMARGQE